MRRREFLKKGVQAGAAVTLWPAGCAPRSHTAANLIVNDVHARLNATPVHSVARPESLDTLRAAVREAATHGRAVSIAGGRHAMGGQQFGRNTVLIDTTRMNRVVEFDDEHGQIEVEAGIQWPQLISYLQQASVAGKRCWSIIQKQTGADGLCIGGALSANIHGRGLQLKPFINDIESFTLINDTGKLLRCSRQGNAELFSLAIGGYGLFGVVWSVRLRLRPRTKLQRIVRIIDVDHLMPAFQQRIDEGCEFGDFQFAVDPKSRDFLRRGVFSCYRPVELDIPIPAGQRSLSESDWSTLVALAHADPTRAFEQYSAHYLATSGQIYWSDTHQLSNYVRDYHVSLDPLTTAGQCATEVITELYVPRLHLAQFLDVVRDDCGRHNVKLIYGTIRLIERDDESYLAWARQPWACIVLNLHVNHSPEGLRRAAQHFRMLIDHAIRYDGSYFLTYHRYAQRDQVLRCYPQFPEFLRLKRRYDPGERFQSDWYRHYRDLLSDLI